MPGTVTPIARSNVTMFPAMCGRVIQSSGRYAMASWTG